jgi:hypothetical protein
MFVAPTYSEFIKQNQLLPHELRERAVLIMFQQPFPDEMISEFYRIHFSDEMLDGGEAEFYQSEIFQPERVKPKLCPGCGQMMKRISPVKSKCINPRCVQPDGVASDKLEFIDGPVRGVIAVLTFPDFVVEREENYRHWVGLTYENQKPKQIFKTRTREFMDRVLLVLDRRYSEKTLGGVKRTAGLLCEQLGYGIY